MEFDRLEKNIQDVIKEEQIKLGYRKETIHLYYPLQSLNQLLHTEYGEEAMTAALEEFSEYASKRLGTIGISNQKERFCLTFEPKASEYVHTHTKASGFLYDFIALVSKHGVEMEEVLSCFQNYSGHVHIEKTRHGEFDLLVYFEDGKPDEYRYCLKKEGHHIIYHRFTIEDYEAFQFEQI